MVSGSLSVFVRQLQLLSHIDYRQISVPSTNPDLQPENVELLALGVRQLDNLLPSLRNCV